MGGHFHIAFFALAAVVLAVTGAEALYADMGHFGRAAITWGWLGLVLPALVLNYFGQGALLPVDQSVVVRTVLPAGAGLGADTDGGALHRCDGDRLPVGDHRRLLGGLAGRSDRLPAADAGVAHLELPFGQIVRGPTACCGSRVLSVFAFRSSSALGYAYGMAVTGTITASPTLLFLYIARTRWRAPLWLVIISGER